MTEKTRFVDLTPEEFIALVQADHPATATKAVPANTPADPLDRDIEAVRVAVVEAAQRMGDATIGRELQAFARRIRSLAGIQAPASTTLTDSQAPMPTTKAAEPGHEMEHFVQAFKASASAASPDLFADVFGYTKERE